MTTSNNPRDSDCGGFYHWPPLWIGTPPVEQGADLTPALMNAEVFSSNLGCGVRLKVSKQALFVFDFAQWEPGSASLATRPLNHWEERVFARMRFINLFLVCFYTSIFRIQKRAPPSPKLFIDYTTYVAPRSFALNPWHVTCDSRQASVIRDAEEQHVKFKPVCMTVPENVLQAAVDMTDAAIIKDFPNVAILAELLLHSYSLYESGKYAASHISAWTIAEWCLNELWETHLRELDNQHTAPGSEEKFINSERKQKLTGRDFTASILSEFLSLSGILPLDKYKLASRVRQTRNDWLHNLHTIAMKDAAEAIMLAQFMLRETGVVDVEDPLITIRSLPIAWASE
jgi:hypothetical protein